MFQRALQHYFSSLLETSMDWLNAVADKSSIVGEEAMHSTYSLTCIHKNINKNQQMKGLKRSGLLTLCFLSFGFLNGSDDGKEKSQVVSLNL